MIYNQIIVIVAYTISKLAISTIAGNYMGIARYTWKYHGIIVEHFRIHVNFTNTFDRK